MLKFLGKTMPHFSISLICYVIISLLLGKNFSFKFLFISIFAGVAPDLDFISYFILRKRYGFTTHQHLHFLFIWIIGFLVVYLLSGIYAAFLFLFPIAVHLMYDATDIQGLWFFIPITKRHFRLKNFTLVDSEKDFQRIHSNLRKGMYKRSMMDEINIRFELTKNEIIFFIFSIFSVLLYGYFC